MSKIKLNAQTESIILSAIEEGASYAIAAGSAGIHKNTLINWIKKGQKERAVEPYKSFIKKLRVSESKAALLHLGVVKAAALDGQWKASLAMLERFRTLEDSHDIEEPIVREPIKNYRVLLETGLSEIQEAMSAAKKSESWQAYASLFGKSLTLMDQIKTLDAEEGRVDSMDSLTDEQLIKTITDYIVALPKGLRQRVEDELSELSKSNVVILRRP